MAWDRDPVDSFVPWHAGGYREEDPGRCVTLPDDQAPVASEDPDRVPTEPEGVPVTMAELVEEGDAAPICRYCDRIAVRNGMCRRCGVGAEFDRGMDERRERAR